MQKTAIPAITDNSSHLKRSSQNAVQAAASTSAYIYSYTIYDELGRITEVGELTQAQQITTAISMDDVQLGNWLSGASERREVTRTYYDNALFTVPAFTQDNLRNRVASVTITELRQPPFSSDDEAYNYATHYSYDIHGNVKALVQDNPDPALESISQRYKRIDYIYNLISRNVKEVHYQNGAADQFFHRYEYDADNRITNVFTGKDGVIWDRDAKYFYYKHGPLARTEIGENQAQGMDYVYTIHGWLKGMNSNTLQTNRDIGKDGETSAAGNEYLAANPQVHSKFGKDAFGYSLGFYEGDYQAIDNINTENYFIAGTAGSGLVTDRNDLFNGNISHMVTTLTNPLDYTVMAQGTAYKYDQLNRIKSMRAHRNLDFTNNIWPAASGDNGSYAADYTYNANGSITGLKRNGLASVSNGDMDDLTYVYETIENGYKRNTNKLRQIIDAVAPGTYDDDMDSQGADNYDHDAIGNLIKDQFECIENIEWSVYGKVLKVTRTPGCTTEGTAMPDLEFKYDAGGNMIAKIVKPANQLNNPDEWETTWYVHDAQGNKMSAYRQKRVSEGGEFVLEQQQLYGSSHIGTYKPDLDLSNPPAQSNTCSRTLGIKNYFLGDHRGNNNVTVSDRKLPVEDALNPGTIAYFESHIVRAVDYYPFGRQMNGRIFSKDESEFGYNGKQNIKEWSMRLGGPQNYGFRIYFPDRGGFGSVDPLTSSYPWYTPYQFAGNKPILFIDLDGKEESLEWMTNFMTGFSKQLIENVDGILQASQIAAKLLEGNTLCPTGDCRLNEEQKAAAYLISHPRELQKLVAEIVDEAGEDLKEFVGEVASGDAEAIGRLAAELALLAVPADEVTKAARVESKLAQKVMDDIVIKGVGEKRVIVKAEEKILEQVDKVVTRTTRSGEKGVSIFKKGKIIDITKDRVKEFEPQPLNPTGKPNQINFSKNPDKLPKGSEVVEGSKGKKRTPTKSELKILEKSKDK